MPVLLQPVPVNRVELQIIGDYLYLIGIFNNSKYSIFRTELQSIKKIALENELEEEKTPLHIVHSEAELFNNPLGSDIIIQVERKEIPVHKEVLGRASEVFEEMFKVIETDKLLITEFDFATMHALLEQIYNYYETELPLDPVAQLELLRSAAKYKLEPLMRRIEKECPITSGNLEKIYEIAKRLGNQELVGRCKEHAKSNWGEVQRKLGHENTRTELIEYMIGRNECKHEHTLLFTT